MKKAMSLLIALMLIFTFASCGENNPDEKDKSGGPDSGYGIKIYCDLTVEEAEWLWDKAREAGFELADGAVTAASSPDYALEAAAEKGDADLIIGLDDMHWSALASGSVKGLKLTEWVPSWGESVRDFAFPGKAYGLTSQNAVIIARTDIYGVWDDTVSLAHWTDIADCGYSYYRPGRSLEGVDSLILYSLLYPYADPSSPAGGISLEGWKALWNYSGRGLFTGNSTGFSPLNKGYVQLSAVGSGTLAENLAEAAGTSSRPIEKDKWAPVRISDGCFYLTRYVGIAEKSGRTAGETEQVKAFGEWLGSAEVQAAWAEKFGLHPVSTDACARLEDAASSVYELKNITLTKAPGTDVLYADYVAAHAGEWKTIVKALGFFWTDATKAPAQPSWDKVNWGSILE